MMDTKYYLDTDSIVVLIMVLLVLRTQREQPRLLGLKGLKGYSRKKQVKNKGEGRYG
jgi:hypothetical protein